MAEALPSCSELSLSLGEALDATAPTEAAFLVIEQPGPWGRDALLDSAIEADVAGELAQRTKAAGVRVQVVRRSKSRYSAPTRSAWLAHVRPESRFLERIEFSDPRELLDVDLAGVVEGRPTGRGSLESEPLLLVCTHGTRDACCAKHGLGLYRALCLIDESRLWHASHLGGHRFAPTMACLPHGLWLGRVPPARAGEVREALLADRVPVEFLRGRAGQPTAAQAAEAALRRRERIDGLDAVHVAPMRQTASGEECGVRGNGHEWVARVRKVAAGGVRPLSCGADAKREDPGAYEVELTPA